MLLMYSLCISANTGNQIGMTKWTRHDALATTRKAIHALSSCSQAGQIIIVRVLCIFSVIVFISHSQVVLLLLYRQLLGHYSRMVSRWVWIGKWFRKLSVTRINYCWFLRGKFQIKRIMAINVRFYWLGENLEIKIVK